jgi:hypothetical protein
MTGDQDPPEFGPRGYLPERAAQRARKIVLRAPLGIQWVVASLLTGAVIVVAAAVFLTRAGDAPGDPFVAVGPVEAVEDARYDSDLEVLLVGAVGRIRAFAVDASDLPVFCVASRQIESPSGRVWHPTGRALDGGDPLVEHPVVVFEGVVHVDPTSTLPPQPSEDTDAEPACF